MDGGTACPASAFRYAFAQDGEIVMSFSGFLAGLNTTNVWRYNALTNVWTKRAKFLPPRKDRPVLF